MAKIYLTHTHTHTQYEASQYLMSSAMLFFLFRLRGKKEQNHQTHFAFSKMHAFSIVFVFDYITLHYIFFVVALFIFYYSHREIELVPRQIQIIRLPYYNVR